MNCVCFERTSRIALYNKRRKAEREREREQGKKEILQQRKMLLLEGNPFLPCTHFCWMPCHAWMVLSCQEEGQRCDDDVCSSDTPNIRVVLIQP